MDDEIFGDDDDLAGCCEMLNLSLWVWLEVFAILSLDWGL